MSLPRPPPLPLRCFGLALHCTSCQYGRCQLQRNHLTGLFACSLTYKQTRQAEFGVSAAATSSRFSGVGAEQAHRTPLDTEGELRKLQDLRNPSTHKAKNDRRSERNKYLAPKNLEPNIPRQAPKTQLLKPRRDRVDQQQRQENNNEPARHTAAYSA